MLKSASKADTLRCYLHTHYTRTCVWYAPRYRCGWNGTTLESITNLCLFIKPRHCEVRPQKKTPAAEVAKHPRQRRWFAGKVSLMRH